MNIEIDQGSVIFAPDAYSESSFTSISLVISSVGLSLSILSFMLLVTTAGLFPEWRQRYKNQLLIQFMLARLAYTFVRYVFDLQRIFDFCGGISCIIYLDEFSMIYTEIALVAWMYTFSRQMYESLVVVFTLRTPNIWKVSIVTWIVPLCVAMILYILNFLQTGKDLLIFFLYLALIKWPLLITNAVLLIMILTSLKKRNRKEVHVQNTKPRIVLVMNLMIFFFCVQQVIVDIYKLLYIIFDMRSIILIFFNISTMFHCVCALTFWIFGNQKTRQMWGNLLCCRKKVPLSPQSSVNS